MAAAQRATSRNTGKGFTKCLTSTSIFSPKATAKCASCSAAKVLDKPPDEKERLKAAELLGKRFSLFKDGIEAKIEPSDKLDSILRQLSGNE